MKRSSIIATRLARFYDQTNQAYEEASMQLASVYRIGSTSPEITRLSSLKETLETRLMNILFRLELVGVSMHGLTALRALSTTANPRCADCFKLQSELTPGNSMGYSTGYQMFLCANCAMERGE